MAVVRPAGGNPAERIVWLLPILLALLTSPALALYPDQLWPSNPDQASGPPVLPNPDRSSRTYVDNMSELRSLLDALPTAANRTIIIRSGTYSVSAPLEIGNTPRQNPATYITIRGETNSPIDTVIYANNADHVFEIFDAGHIRFAYLAMGAANKSNVLIHGYSLTGDNVIPLTIPPDPEGGLNQRGYDFYHCIFYDAKGPLLMANPGTRDSTIQYCWFSYLGGVPGTGMPEDGHAVGVHLRTAINWRITHCSFENIFHAGTTDTDVRYVNPAVLAIDESKNTQIEFCNFNQCEVAVGFGIKETLRGNISDAVDDHEGGRIANNMISRVAELTWQVEPKPPAYVDRGDLQYGVNIDAYLSYTKPAIYLTNAPKVVVEHNTFLLSGTADAIRARGPRTVDLTIQHNLIPPGNPIDVGGASTNGDVNALNNFTAAAGMFVDPGLNLASFFTPEPITDLHLSSAVAGVVNQRPRLATTTSDFDLASRSDGLADYGADEWGADRPAPPPSGGGGGGGGDNNIPIRPRRDNESETGSRPMTREEYEAFVKQNNDEEEIPGDEDGDGQVDHQGAYRKGKRRSKSDGGGSDDGDSERIEQRQRRTGSGGGVGF